MRTGLRRTTRLATLHPDSRLRIGHLSLLLAALGLVVLPAAPAVSREPRAAAEEAGISQSTLEKLGLAGAAIDEILAGSFVEAPLAPSSKRELSLALLFLVETSPRRLAPDLDDALAIREDANTLSFGRIEDDQPEHALRSLHLSEEDAHRWLSASPGEEINLSSDELERLAALRKRLKGATSVKEAVSKAVRDILLNRYRSYRATGLSGVASYERGGNTTLDAGEELRRASLASRKLEVFRPELYDLLLGYPEKRPSNFKESFFWLHYLAHGERVVILTHRMTVPEGAGFVSIQRQFYVSRGYNVEQSLSSLARSPKGTLVVYTNRTSTDQATGFGGSARRSIGRKLLASQLEQLYEKVGKSAAAGE